MSHPGRERTEAELRELYAAAGFRLTRFISVKPGLDIADGVTMQVREF